MPVPNQTQAAPTETPSLSSEMMQKWNNLITFAKSKGYSGMEELNHNAKLRQKVFDEYNAANPKDTLDQSIVQPVQDEIQNYKQKALQAIQSGTGQIQGGGAKNFMAGISKSDGIFGSKTSAWSFPSAYIQKAGVKKD